MLPSLVSRGLLADDTVHSYHCSCYNCSFDSSFSLRCQSDSSCNGEIISKPFHSMDYAAEVMTALQDVAVEADATPGYEAGFHVHVDVTESLDTADEERGRERMFWQWLRWEPAMHALASGAFRRVREFNPTCRRRVFPSLSENRTLIGCPWYGTYSDTVSDEILKWCEAELTPAKLKAVQLWAFQAMSNADRHSALAVETRFETFEFRLWNSTRSAWRMEMFARLSLAWMDLKLIDILSESPVPGTIEQQINTFRDSLIICDFTREAELVERQVQYNTEHEGLPDPIFVAA